MRRILANHSGTRWFIIIILLYAGAAAWFAMTLPAHGTPNELLNFEYIQVMRQIRGLPNRGLVDSEVRYTEWHQPPLYFTFAALVSIGVPVAEADANPPPPIEWPENPSYVATHHGNLNPVIHVTPQNTPLLYVSRLAAMLLGVVGLAALYRAGRDVYSSSIALLMVSLLAFQPNYLHLSASVNNDMPLAAVTAMVMAYAILLIHHEKGPGWYFGLGLLTAATVLTKASGVFAFGYMAAAWFLLQLRHRQWSRTLKSIFFSLAGVLPFWIAWLYLNTLRMRDTLGVQGSLPVDRVLTLNPGAYRLLIPWLDDMWRSFWLDWTAGALHYAADWYYLLWFVLLAVALLGWLKRPAEKNSRPPLLVVLVGFMGISYLYFAVKALTVKEAGYMVPEGRWWLPAMPAIAWLAAAGYARWWPRSWRDTAVLVAALIPIFSTFLLLVFYLPAVYPRAAYLPQIANQRGQEVIVFGERIALLSAEIAPLTMGEEGLVTLTWQALEDIQEDYLVTVELTIPEKGEWRIIERQRSVPGLGLNPTSEWRKGDILRDSWFLKPTGELDGPVLANLIVQVKLDGEELATTLGGHLLQPAVAAATVVRPSQSLAFDRQPLEVNFADQIELLAVDTTSEAGILEVNLWWRAAQQPDQDYTVFLHLLDEQGNLTAQDDSMPINGASLTSLWNEGEIIRDSHRLTNAEEGKELAIGLYELQSGLRLPASEHGQPLPDSAYHLELEQ